MVTHTLTHELPLTRRETEFLLGEWRVQPPLNRLVRVSGVTQERTLEPRLMHLLCLLAAQPGQVVDRDALHLALWPRVVVNENSLTRAVSELRRQLGTDTLPGSAYLLTVSKRGYRLSPELLSEVPATPVPVEPQQVTQLTNFRWQGRSLAWVALAVLGLVLGATALPRREATSPAVATSDPAWSDQVVDAQMPTGGKLIPLSADDVGLPVPESERPILSTDGSTMAYIRHEGGGSTVYLSHLNALDRPLALYRSTDILYNLSWSPVGKGLLMARRSVGQTAAWRNDGGESADLLLLDLEALEIRVLLDNPPLQSSEAPTKLNLT